MSFFQCLLNWLNPNKIPDSEESIMRDLQTIGIMEV